MKYFVYIIQSRAEKGYYVGLTSNIDKRIRCHNAGTVRSTKHRTPFNLVYSEAFSTRIEAREREKYLKSYRGSKEKLSILENL